MSIDPLLRRASGWLGLLVFVPTLAAVAFDLAGVELLDGSPRPFLKLDATLALSLLGAALWLTAQGRAQLGTGAAVAAALVGTFSLGAGATGSREWFGHTIMTALAALCVITAAAAIVGLQRKRSRSRWPLSAWLANLVVAIGTAALVSLGLQSSLADVRPFPVTPGLALGLILIGSGVLFARPADMHARILLQRTPAGLLARRLFVGAAGIPLLLSGLAAWLIGRGSLSAADGLVLLISLIVLCGFALALFSIETAEEVDEVREEAEQARVLMTARLQEQAAQLQQLVAQRTEELEASNASLRAAAESNALLALVAQNSTNGVIVADAEGRIAWVNAAFTRTTGYTLAEVRGRKPGHVLQGPDTDPNAIQRLREAEHKGESIRVELLNYRKDGTPFYHIIDIQPVRGDGGRIVNYIGNQTEITEQRAAKVRLEQLNHRLELATRAADLGVWEWDPLGRRSEWDARTLGIYGLTAADLTGTADDWRSRLHPEDRAAAVGRLHAAIAGGDTLEHTFRIVRAHDGAERFIQCRAILQRDAQGRLLRIIGTDRDITAEREATRHTQALNERLRLALRSSSFGVWEYDIVHNRRIWDERMMEIYDVAAGSFDAREPLWEARVHAEDRDAAVARVRRVIAGEDEDLSHRFRIQRPDGVVRHMESHGYLQRDSTGRPLRVVGLTRDITEEAELEQALEIAEQRWQLAIEGTNDSVWDWDIVSGQVYHDERWARMLGYEPAEIRNTNDGWKALSHPGDLAENEAVIREHFEQRTSYYQHELRMRAKDGTWRWILDRGRVVRRATDGRPLRMVGTHTDITPRKQLEERLRKSEELANQVSRLALIGGWEIDFQTSRVEWNEGTRRILEAEESFQPTQDNMWQFYPPESLGPVQAALGGTSPEVPAFDLEVQLRTTRGRRIWVRILGQGEFHQGRTVSVHGALQDITQQRTTEESRRELETQLFQAQKMETLGTLAGGIAHDFNNLLTGIIGYHELAADSVPEDHPARMCLNEARNASLRARQLVEQILTFGRQNTTGEHGPIDLALVVEEARRFLRATLPANITIETHLGPGCGPVNADATQIHQVLLNLGSNASHAMRQNGGTLHIALQPAELSPELALTIGGPVSNRYVRLSVADTGHGMDETTRRRIFDPFFTTKKTREGTGLGLAVVHGIVRSHRGAIDVESVPGRGATFHIYLPCTATDSTPSDGQSVVSPSGAGEFICVVDDEDVVASCTKLVLENKGYRALTFGSAEQCLAELQDDPARCGVLITDQTMPGMQGTELAATLRRIYPQLPVVIMSGYFSKISPQDLDELGQIELLAKPFTTDELAFAVHRALHPSPKTE
jgi:PAS domain S-box-containing protein